MLLKNNLRKLLPFLVAGLAMAALVAGFYWRKVTIHIDDQTIQIRPGALTVAQALEAASIRYEAASQVNPAPDQLIPLNGQITVQFAVQAWVWDDGQLHSISGPSKSAAALLESAGISLGSGDRLLWNAQPIPAGGPLPPARPLVLQIQRARTFILDLNGKRRQASTQRANVAGALWDAGVRPGPADLLSSPAGSPLRANQIIAIRPARQLIIQLGGRQVAARSSADTVGQALAEAGLSLQGMDYSIPAEDQPLPADGSIRVVRVREEIQLKETLIPFERKITNDPSLELDQRRVMKPGQFGVKVTRERARFEDDQQISRGIDSDWVASDPVAETVGVGSKVAIQSLDAPNGPIEYWRAVRVYATSYSPCDQGADQCSWATSSGMRLQRGVIAVTLSWYRIIAGMRVYVPGYGSGVIADVGGGIPGTPWIDLGFDEGGLGGAINGWTTMYFLTPAPENTSWTLP